MRVFAGPNGSGKSTVINEIRKTTFNGKPVDFGIYINADEIADQLKRSKLDFRGYNITTNDHDFLNMAMQSGLIGQNLPENEFKNSYNLKGNFFRLTNIANVDKISQILADFIRKKLLLSQKKFSFETVFSHESKLSIMKAAKSQGYKVYLYFVSTNDPKINEYRVKLRVKQGGHDVPPDKIESRYYRSLNLLYEAAQIAYQCYFFDNSNENYENDYNSNCFAHFKVIDGKKQWTINESKVPSWFIKYYSQKIPK